MTPPPPPSAAVYCDRSRPVGYTRSVFVCMLDYSEPARTKALRNSVLFLGHRFPNVRKTTAEALYLKLLANEDIIVDEVRTRPSVRPRSSCPSATYHLFCL